MNTMTEPAKPWYREPWPWILMAGPFTVVVAGVVTVWLASSTADGLVDDDYYKQGLEINQTIERDREAKALGLRAQLMVGESGGQFRVTLSGGESIPMPDTLRLKVLHPTRGGMDHTVVLKHVGGGYYEGALAGLQDAKWRLVLEDMENRWRLTGILHVPKDHLVALSAKV